MSFAQTGSGARFIAAWQVHSPSLEVQLSHHYPGLIPFDEFTVTDDRGARYELDLTPGSDLAWPNMIRLSPAPPGTIRWLDVAPPYRQAIRVDLSAGPASGAMAQVSVSDTTLSAGEHLLVMLAERLLTGTPEFPRRGLLAAPPTSPRQVVAGGFGVIIAALEAADVLSPLSPVPARLATLCASLDLTGHGIAAPPTLDLPEPWLSLLAHYQRRKPEPTQMREGYAALAASLPELDGIRVTLLGLQHTQGGSALHVLVQGRIAGAPARAARHRPELPAVALAQGQRRPVARRPPGPLPPGRPGERDPAPAGAAADPARGLGRGAGRRPVGRGPRHAAAPLEVPVVTGCAERAVVHVPPAVRDAGAVRPGPALPSAGKPGSSGCRATPTPRRSSCWPRSAGTRPAASRSPRRGSGTPPT